MHSKSHSNDLKKQICACLFIFSVGIWFLLQTDLDNHRQFFLPANFDNALESRVQTVSVSGCHIPELDTYDPSIKEALEDLEPPLVCDKNMTGVLVGSNATHLYIDWQVHARFNLTSPLVCCYRPFYRQNVNTTKFSPKADTKYTYSKKCEKFKEAVSVVNEQFVRVECRVEDELIYKDFYSFIPKMFVNKAKSLEPKRNLSVLIIGIDGISRLNFRRQMKTTHKFLTQRVLATEFFGFHKVDYNTFPNLVPVLAGMSEEELTKDCWPDPKVPFDNCSFIWKNFKKKGYITGFGEDSTWMGLFQYWKVGFKDRPTDVYLRTFNHVYEKEIGHEKRLSSSLCAGAKLNIQVLLDAANKFALRLDGKLSFGFFWENSLSHDYLNLPRYGDDIHTALLEGFLDRGIFDRSVVIVMSDHGIRWGKIRTTYQGYIEERLPLLIISCPEWFQKKYRLAWTNFKTNSLRLTTPYDLHETLKEFLDLSQLEDEKILERGKKLEKQKEEMPRGISLFVEVPTVRTCQDANISDTWCSCHKDEEVPTNNTQVVKSALFIVRNINTLVKGYSRCSALTLKSILNARMKVLPSTKTPKEDYFKVDFDERTKEFTIRLKVEPGGGIFEATVQFNPWNEKLRLTGPIGRTNTYGESSYCVSHYKLKLYCYCM